MTTTGIAILIAAVTLIVLLLSGLYIHSMLLAVGVQYDKDCKEARNVSEIRYSADSPSRLPERLRRGGNPRV